MFFNCSCFFGHIHLMDFACPPSSILWLHLVLSAGGHVSGPQPAQHIREAILSLCRELKPEAVSLVDAVAPPDFILNSPIGKSDGQASYWVPVYTLVTSSRRGYTFTRQSKINYFAYK